jgi:hypothetical protein
MEITIIRDEKGNIITKSIKSRESLRNTLETYSNKLENLKK